MLLIGIKTQKQAAYSIGGIRNHTATDVGGCCDVGPEINCCMVLNSTNAQFMIASLHAAYFCALYTSEQCPYITFFF